MPRIHGDQGRAGYGSGERWVEETMKLHIHYGGTDGNISEYFCCQCRQLRLSCIAEKEHCKNCGSRDIITGVVGSLDKEVLIRKLDGFTE